jgi:hypothetical protein
MKRFFSLSLLLTAAAGFASADTITVTCATAGGSGISGSATSNCGTAGGPVAATSLDSIVLTFKFDANFGLAPGSVLEDFFVMPVGSDAFGGAFNHPTDQLVTDSARGIIDTLTINAPTQAEVDAALGGIQIQDNWNSGSGSFNNTAFSYKIDVNYSTAAPEPATLGLMGSALVGLGFLARRRRS